MLKNILVKLRNTCILIKMLSSSEILEEKEKGNIVISPYNEGNLGPNSYDVRLGEYYYSQFQRPFIRNKYPNNDINQEIVDIYSDQKVWHLHRAMKIADILAKLKGSGENHSLFQALSYSILDTDQRIIYIRRGERILGHTQEFIGGKKNITTMIKARSSIGRSGISICMCAGSGDVGYINRWTLEITNHLNCDTFLVVNARVGQILFFHCKEPALSYSGKYQNDSLEYDIDKIRTAWHPDNMLPKLYQDIVDGTL